jgi:hypothetical protein
MNKPTPTHYFIANQWPTKIWVTAFPIGFMIATGHFCWPLLLRPADWTDPLLFGGCCFLGAILGHFVGLLSGWFVLGPMYYMRSVENGEPFVRGDMVQILAGPFRDRVARVLSTFEMDNCAGSHRIRVDLGAEVKDDDSMFSSFEILRIAKAGGEAKAASGRRSPRG